MREGHRHQTDDRGAKRARRSSSLRPHHAAGSSTVWGPAVSGTAGAAQPTLPRGAVGRMSTAGRRPDRKIRHGERPRRRVDLSRNDGPWRRWRRCAPALHTAGYMAEQAVSHLVCDARVDVQRSSVEALLPKSYCSAVGRMGVRKSSE